MGIMAEAQTGRRGSATGRPNRRCWRMERITLSREGGYWVARHTDPRVMQLFGTDALPTPWPATAPAAAVLREIQRLNPDCMVVCREADVVIA